MKTGRKPGGSNRALPPLELVEQPASWVWDAPKGRSKYGMALEMLRQNPGSILKLEGGPKLFKAFHQQATKMKLVLLKKVEGDTLYIGIDSKRKPVAPQLREAAKRLMENTKK